MNIYISSSHDTWFFANTSFGFIMNTVKRNLKALISCIILIAAGANLLFSAEGEFAGKNALYYNKIGWESLEKNEVLKAILYFKNALRQNPNFREALIGMGKSYLKTEAYEEAAKFFEKALRLDNQNPAAVSGLAFAMSGLGRYSESIDLFEKAHLLDGNSIEPYYGIASIYFGMGKDIWAKRKLESIFKINPYHYESLILLSEIKVREKRFSDAKTALEKAINSAPERPEAYVALGALHLGRYRATEDADELADAHREFRNALSKQNENVAANRFLGMLALLKRDYAAAATHFAAARDAVMENAPTHYNCAVAWDKSGNIEAAHADFSKAMKRFPYDSIIAAGFEDFLIAREYKMGSPSRVGRGDAHYEKAIRAQKFNLSDLAFFHSRRAALLNPLKREARKFIKDYYFAQDYYNFYLDELKDMERIFPDEGYREQLNIAIIKRREKLYHRAGFAHEEPHRDVPVVLVLDFSPKNVVPSYFDAGRVIANQLTFALGQFGRMKALNIRERESILGPVTFSDEYLEKNVDAIQRLIREGKLSRVDYLVYGSFLESPDHLSCTFSLINFHNGAIIGDFVISENGHDALPKLAVRSARKLYDFIPYEGRIMKISDEGVMVNLGLYDGVNKDDLLVIYKKMPAGERKTLWGTSKIVLKVTEADTLLSSVVPVKESDTDKLEINDPVYPLQKRRAKKIE